jgi:hypothetical protein
VLGETFGVCIFQESLLRLGEAVAGFGPDERNRLQRAVSKKKRDEMEAVGELFVVGALKQTTSADSPKMVFSSATAERVWAAMKGAADYAFNKCLAGDALLQTGSQTKWTLAELYRKLKTIDTPGPDCGWCGKAPSRPKTMKRGLCAGCYAWHQKFHDRNRNGLTLLSYDFADGRIRPKRIKDVHYNGVQKVYRITLSNGTSVTATAQHRFLSADGWVTTDVPSPGDVLIVDGGYETHRYKSSEYRTTVGQPQRKGMIYGKDSKNFSYVDGGFVALKKWTEETHDSAVCFECGMTPDEGRLLENGSTSTGTGRTSTQRI